MQISVTDGASAVPTANGCVLIAPTDQNGSGAVYAAVHRESLRTYIGQTKGDPHVRWAQHVKAARLGRTSHFPTAIRRYGADAFDFHVLASGLDKQARDILEIALIRSCDSIHRGFNISRGGDGGGISPEARARLSASKLGKKMPAHVGAKISAIKRGLKLSEEHKAAIARASRRMWSDPEHAKRVSESKKGYRHSAETRQKIGAAHVGMKRSDETCRRISEAKRAANALRKAQMERTHEE